MIDVARFDNELSPVPIMNFIRSLNRSRRRLIESVTFLALASTVSVFAAPINYGDFSGGSVMYLDVTETANTPGDAEPLYGPAAIANNYLDFDPAGFTASGVSGGADITDGQLSFRLAALPNSSLETLTIRESGDYTLFGTGSASTQIGYATAISSIAVLEVDGLPLAAPAPLVSASASGSRNLSSNPGQLNFWTLGLTYNVDAALSSAGIPYTFGATRLEIVVDNSLLGISEPFSIAYVAKKDFSFDVQTAPISPFLSSSSPSVVPEPSSALLVVIAAALMQFRRRRGSAPGLLS